MMWLILLRMIATLLCGVVGGAACLILLGIGQKGDTMQCAIITAIIVWLIQPSVEDRADFAAFQKSRDPWIPPDNRP